MVTILLEKILSLLTGWSGSFSQFVIDLMTKLNLIETETANLPDIKSNTDDIKNNTGAVVTPISNINDNVSSIKTNSDTIKNTVGTMSNQLSTISTNVGTASAYAEDCANNTLDCANRLVTIGSDTTQIRTNSNTITSDVADIKQALGYYIANTPVTEDVEGSICNFDTDLTDYLQKAVCTIPSDANGFSSIKIIKNGKNLLDDNITYQQSPNQLLIGQTVDMYNYPYHLKAGKYTVSASINKLMSFYYRSVNGYVSIGTLNSNRTFTINEDIEVCFYVYTSSGVVSSDINWLMVEYGETATTYEPYKSITDTVSLGSTITDGAEIDLLTGIVKINTSPVTYSSITPIAIRTYKGVNNIYADVGDMSVTYRETLKHYLDKNQ